jgi:sporulation protein YlmC with PRC-barrel domain
LGFHKKGGFDMDKRLYELFLSSLIGNQVNNEEGECLGKIQELVIDPNTGHVKDVVLSLGDAPKFGSALSAIPWEALKLTENGDQKRTNGAVGGNSSNGNLQSGKREPPNRFSVYSFPVRRFR